MSTTTATAPTPKKVDLTAKTEGYFAYLRAEKRARGIRYVEEVLLPQLITLAENGSRFYCTKPPADVELEDVIKALHEKANCRASRTGYQGKISISW